MDYWRIWFEAFEDDKPIGTGVYNTFYKSKSSAIRRARQLWGKERHNPMTGTTIKYKWIVSKNNPWSTPKYEHDKVMERLHQTLGE